MTASMIAAARRTIVLADSTKFDQKLLGHIASLGQIDILVTDAKPPKKISEALNEFRIQVIVAPPLNSKRNGMSTTNIFDDCSGVVARPKAAEFSGVAGEIPLP